MPHTELDEVAGLAAGYSAKVLNSRRTERGRFNRNLGPSAWDGLLGALKLRLVFERED
jgi:hypothetical protein